MSITPPGVPLTPSSAAPVEDASSRFLPGSTEFYWVLLGPPGCLWVSLSVVSPLHVSSSFLFAEAPSLPRTSPSPPLHLLDPSDRSDASGVRKDASWLQCASRDQAGSGVRRR